MSAKVGLTLFTRSSLLFMGGHQDCRINAGKNRFFHLSAACTLTSGVTNVGLNGGVRVLMLLALYKYIHGNRLIYKEGRLAKDITKGNYKGTAGISVDDAGGLALGSEGLRSGC